MIEDALRAFLALPPARFKYLESVCLRRTLSPDGATPFDLTLSLLEGLVGRRLQLYFTGVRELEIGNVDGLMAWLLEIHPAKDRGLEGIGFRVVESEHELIRFWCEDFSCQMG